MSHNTDPEQLLSQIQKGNAQAFCELVDALSPAFYRLAYRFTANPQQAEDIVQEAFLKVWQTPFLWRAELGISFTTWFYRVVVNLCIDASRKNKTKRDVLAQMVAIDSPMANDEQIALEERQIKLELAISELPIKQQVALNLRYYEELSYEQAARVMGVRVTTLQSLLVRAKRNLKKQLGMEAQS